MPGLTRASSFAERLLGRSLDGVLAFDRECRCTYWSPAMERISGVTPAEALGRSAFEVLPFLLETGEDRFFREALAGRAAVSRDRPYRVPDTGRRGFYEGYYSPLEGDDGEVVGGVAIVRDITERREAEARLRETETRFTTMADSSPVLLWQSGTDGLCNFFNQSWLDFTGRTLEEEWGVGWAEGVHHEDFQRCMDTYLAAFNERRVFEMEYRLRHRGGEYRWILDRGAPRYAPDGTFAGYIGSCVDITERKRMEGELRQSVSLRDEFLSIASHELRTPLTALSLEVQRLLRAAEETPGGLAAAQGVPRALGSIDRQVGRLGKLVDTLLDVSRISAGRLDLELEPVDLAALVREVLGRLAHDVKAAGCALELRAAAPVGGVWDRSRLDQVATNLLSNALKYGAGKPVEVAVEAVHGVARLTIRDRGIGIARDDQPRLFERFARAVPERHYGGLGLGLFIVRQIVAAHGGSVRLESEAGAGATFTVSLPMASNR